MKLRQYQLDACDSVMAEWEKVNSVLGVMATGGGKTQVACELIKRRARRAICLMHRDELVGQAVRRLRDFGLEAEIEKADSHASTTLWNRAPVVVATPQTLYGNNDARLKRLNPSEFETLWIDECFVAGTLIDGHPIETLRVGDSVKSFNHELSIVERKKITKLFCKPARNLLRIKGGGREIICTPNHPFFNGVEYVPAGLLCRGYTITLVHDEPTLHLPLVQDALLFRQEDYLGPLQEARTSVLLNELFGSLPPAVSQRVNEAYERTSWWSGILFSLDEQNEPEVRCRAYATKQSNAPPWFRSQNATGIEGKDVSGPWRERPDHSTTKDACRSPTFADGTRDYATSGSQEVQKCSKVLQGRHCRSVLQISNRSRRQNASPKEVEISGHTQNANLGCLRVDSVEILEPGSDGTFGGLCPDGLVYNIEVEDNHNYFAEGVLVHNCHHYSGAKAFERVVTHFKSNPNLKIFGCTATPDRHDNIALARIFDSVAFDIEIQDLIEQGWLVDIDQRMVRIESLDLSECRITAGDLNGRDLAEVMEEEHTLIGIADASLKIVGDKKTLLFAVTVKQAERYAEIFNRYKVNSAKCVFGHTPEKDRRDTFKEFEAGEIQILVNVGVVTEGVDVPGIEAVVMARPTKSRALYAQMIGRGTRPLTGTVHDGLPTPELRKEAIALSRKPILTVLDFKGNSGRHKLVTTADILGGRMSLEAKALAIKRIEEKGEGRMMDELAKAEEDIKNRIEQMKRAGIRGQAVFQETFVDPFDVFSRRAEKWKGHVQTRPLTEKQRKRLTSAGYDPDKMTPQEGQATITKMFAMSDPQRSVLKRAGYTDEELAPITKWQASAMITAVKANHWKRPTVGAS